MIFMILIIIIKYLQILIQIMLKFINSEIIQMVLIFIKILKINTQNNLMMINILYIMICNILNILVII